MLTEPFGEYDAWYIQELVEISSANPLGYGRRRLARPLGSSPINLRATINPMASRPTLWHFFCRWELMLPCYIP